MRSKYLKEGEKEPLEELIIQRRKLQAQLKDLKEMLSKTKQKSSKIK